MDPVSAQAELKKNAISIVVALVGAGKDYHLIRDPYISDVQILAASREDIEWVIVAGSRSFSNINLPHEDRYANVRLVRIDEDLNGVAEFFSLGLLVASGNTVAFSWPGVRLTAQLEAVEILHRELIGRSGKFVAGLPSVAEERGTPGLSFLPQANVDYSSLMEHALGRIQMLDMVPMSNSLVDMDFARKVGFRPTRDVGRCFWWDFSLRAARNTEITMVNQPAPFVAFNWYNYPLGAIHDAPYRCVVRNILKRVPPSSDRIDRNEEVDSIDDYVRGLFTTPINIVIVSGVHDAAHAQLCFLNYFEEFDHLGVLNWRIMLDTNCKPSDLLGEDLVIFCRTRCDNGVNLAKFCRESKIPTIAMIDDNWIRIGECWPEYSSMFSMTSPSMRNFSSILRQCDLTLCYNRVLEADIAPMARRVARIETNVRLDDFSGIRLRARAESRHEITVGYAGSGRRERSAFWAMSRLVRDTSNVKLFIMSNEMPPELVDVDPSRIVFKRYTHSYPAYINTVADHEVDILVAPLDDNLFEASKCPNKYLEISAFRAVGIYSSVEPYTTYVKNWETGILVNNNAEDWYAALSSVTSAGASGLRAKLIEQAYEEIKNHFDTRERATDFFKTLNSVIGRSSAD